MFCMYIYKCIHIYVYIFILMYILVLNVYCLMINVDFFVEQPACVCVCAKINGVLLCLQRQCESYDREEVF